jgi:hypothetical protein
VIGSGCSQTAPSPDRLRSTPPPQHPPRRDQMARLRERRERGIRVYQVEVSALNCRRLVIDSSDGALWKLLFATESHKTKLERTQPTFIDGCKGAN